MRSLKQNLILALTKTSAAALLSVSVLAACGAQYGTRGGSGDNGPGSRNTTVGTLPEAHGSMDFHETNRQEAAQPAGTVLTGVAGVPTTGDDGSANPDGTSGGALGTANKQKNICEGQYDATKPLPDDLVCARCERGQFQQPGLARKQLDILFVADTSPSLADTRDQIAKSVSKFVEALPDNTDYRFAVLPAHSDKSYDPAKKPSSGLGGKLFANPGEPVVLKGSDYRSMSALTAVLERKVLKMPIDKSSDGGELGLYSLNLAIQEPLLSQNRTKGFFREGAALAVIFISDENDLCSYPGLNPSTGAIVDNADYPAGITPNDKDPDRYAGAYNGNKPENPERVAARFYCQDKEGHQTVTDKTVYTKLRELMAVKGSPSNEARPLLISGVLYTDPASVPTTPPANEPFPQYFAEKEVGYGYTNMIALNGGQAADIGKANYDEGLGAIGKQAAIKLQVKTQFQLKDGVAVDPKSVCVMVNGREATEMAELDPGHTGFTYTYSSATREVLLQGVGATDDKGSASKVDIFYCEPPSVNAANPEKYSRFDLPSLAQHYRAIPVPTGCKTLNAKIKAGELDNG